uniref:Predicted protein n=1 Tax=Hordeum vulgare subsp. vulgare TaxID=112509 RepID=F2E1G4_HORVV|nr:predicted protein [Hordeum vulgare subsp. vulgare]
MIDSWSLTPENSSDAGKFTLQTSIGSPNTALTSSAPINDFATDSAYTYLQTKDSLIKLDSTNLNNIVNTTNLTSEFASGTVECTKVLTEGSNVHNPFCSISYCKNTSNSSIGYFIPLGCESPAPKVYPAFLTTLNSPFGMRALGNYLFALENPDGQPGKPGSKFHYYNFTNPAAPRYLGYIDGSFFNATSFQATGWEYAPSSDMFFFVDGRFGLHLASFDFQNSGTFDFLFSYNLFTDAGLMADNIPATSMFLDIGFLWFDPLQNMYFALTTDTYNSYYVSIIITSPSALNLTVLTVYKKTLAARNLPTITSAFVNSGFWYFAVSSYDPSTQEGFVTVYNATMDAQGSQIKTLSFPPATTGSAAFSLIGGQNAKLWMYTPASASVSAGKAALTQPTVQEFNLYSYFAIDVSLSSNPTSKYVNLTGSSDQNNFTVSFNITYASVPKPDNPTKWWIWAIVGGAVLLIAIAIGIYVCCKKKKQENEGAHEPLIADNA